MAAKHDKLVGAKAQAVKCVLELPESSREQILATVSLWGWDGFLTAKYVYLSSGISPEPMYLLISGYLFSPLLVFLSA